MFVALGCVHGCADPRRRIAPPVHSRDTPDTIPPLAASPSRDTSVAVTFRLARPNMLIHPTTEQQHFGLSPSDLNRLTRQVHEQALRVPGAPRLGRANQQHQVDESPASGSAPPLVGVSDDA